MYRRTNKTQKNYRKSYNKVNVASAQWEQSDTAVQRIPELRRVIEITDYDKGVPTTQVRAIQNQSYWVEQHSCWHMKSTTKIS